jgi:hypothetical protein
MDRPPALTDFTRKERAIIRRFRTPLQVQNYLRSVPYNLHGHTLRTFRKVVADHTANCIEAALSAATIMEQHGYPPILLDLESVDGLDHVLFLYRVKGRWGTISRSRDVGLHGRKPLFRTVRDLAFSYVDPYVDGSGRIKGYGVADLRELVSVDWRLSERNVWAVERGLIDMPHTKLKASNRRHQEMLRKFLQFKEENPDRPYTDYKNKESWL